MKTMKILLASDGSAAALSAADWINQHMDPQRVQIIVATVMQPPSIAWTGMSGLSVDISSSREIWEESWDNAHRQANAVLNSTRNRLPRFSSVTEKILTGPPAAAIVQYAKQAGVEMVVMGRRGHSMLGNLIGSVSFGVLQRAEIPVTIIEGRMRANPS